MNIIIPKLYYNPEKYSYFEGKDPIWKKLRFNTKEEYEQKRDKLFNEMFNKYAKENKVQWLNKESLLAKVNNKMYTDKKRYWNYSMKRKLTVHQKSIENMIKRY